MVVVVVVDGESEGMDTPLAQERKYFKHSENSAAPFAQLFKRFPPLPLPIELSNFL